MKLTVRNTFALIFIAALVLLIVGLTALDSVAAGQETKRVFVLNSYHRGFTFSDNEMRGIDDAFDKSGIKIETYISYMDMKRIPTTPQYFSQLKELIREGYKGVRFDAVLACDNDALEFMRRYRDELFPGVPVVFTSINDFDERMLDGRRDITGTIENTDYTGTINIALKLHPATKNIVAVTDSTTTGKAYRSAVEKIRPDFPQSLGFTYLSLGDMTLDELAEKMSKLNSDSIVLLLVPVVDKNGTYHTVQESTSLISKSSPVSVFVLVDTRMGFGALGGHLVSGYSQGETAAQMVVKILGGTDVRTIPVLLESPNIYMFDYRAMQRFSIAEKDLPQGSILINKPFSVLDKYGPQLFTILGVFIVLCGLVVYLLLEIMRRKRVEKALRESTELFSLFIRYSPIYTYIKEVTPTQSIVLQASDNFRQMIGIPGSEMAGKAMTELFSPELAAKITADDCTVVSVGDVLRLDEELNGRSYTTIKFPIVLGDKTLLAGYTIDITERKRAEEALQDLSSHQEALLLAIPDIIMEVDNNKVYTWANQVGLDFFGEEVIGKEAAYYFEGEQNTYEVIDPVFRGSKDVIYVRSWQRRRDGQKRLLAWLCRALYDQAGNVTGAISSARDITERMQAETEKKKLEEQFRQAQKMEAIGQLAGGIAHDFNNMLNIILGYSQIALKKLEPSDPLNASLQEIMNAAQHSSDLVRQLMAFARKQTIAPKVLDLNDAVAGMLNMLRKLIGEDIDLLWMPAANLWPVKMDPTQIDQLLANLAVNARDSISGGGKITIKIGKAEFDDSYCAQHSGFVPGQYVLLAVSDNGCGMDKETCEKIFEPFFTTKAIGKGTGMGLATVYGIVKQNNGLIDVYSEQGKGSTFKVYLPRCKDKDEKTAIDELPAHTEHLTGTETVLLVEDNEALLKMAKIMLEELGYTVLALGSPNEAIKLAGQYAGDIHLLVTDVVMPDMSGGDLRRRISALRPDMKILFMSGYTANVIAHSGILDEGVNFLQKPFHMDVLAMKVREALK